MDIPPPMTRRNHPPPPVVIPDELIVEILSYVGVKTLMQLKTVCKAWKTLISNPTFVNLHLQRSHRNPQLTLLWREKEEELNCFTYTLPYRVLAPFPVRHLIESPLDDDGVDVVCYGVKLKDYYYRLVGSYNGLLCFYDWDVIDWDAEYWIHFQNPATGTISEKLGHFQYSRFVYFKFSFGYDISTATYKVVAFCVEVQHNYEASWTSQVKVFNLGDNNSWRNIQSFPVAPLCCLEGRIGNSKPNDGVHFIGTVNWLAHTNTLISSYDYKNIPHVKNFVILSLSLSTETYTQFQLPKGFNEVPRVQPTLRVLSNYLCFSHDFKGTEFVIWQMREFGVPESWTQLIKVSYLTLQMKNLQMDDHVYDIQLLPLYLSENSNTLIFANNTRDEEDGDKWVIIYSWKDDRVEKKKTRVSKEIEWFSAIHYVESLVPIP